MAKFSLPMKKLLFLLLLVSGIASAQYTPTGSKTRFSNGIGLGSKLDAAFGTVDSLVLYTKLDSTLMFKYKGTARALAYASQLDGYVTIAGTQTITGAKTFSSTINSSVLNGAAFKSDANTTGYSFMEFLNTGASGRLGIESSTGINVFAGASPYATVIGTGNATPLEFFTANAKRGYYSSSGTFFTLFGANIVGGNGDQLSLDNTGQRFTQTSWKNNGTTKVSVYLDNTASRFETLAGTGIGQAWYTNGTERMNITSAGITNVLSRLNVNGATDNSAKALNINGVFGLASLNTAPSSASDTGVTGEIRWDANYMYVCVATNTWKRSAITTW